MNLYVANWIFLLFLSLTDFVFSDFLLNGV